MLKKPVIIEIDRKSGFCFGVVKAIGAAEEGISSEEPVHCLGDIVHNSQEVQRLSDMGLKVITREEMKHMAGTRVMIRAHGEPPETYELARKQNIRVIDATCPIVLKLQQRVKKGAQEMQEAGGFVYILGKEGHAEVVGLLGQTGRRAKVIQDRDDLKDADFSRPSRLYAQTTEDPEKLKKVAGYIEERYRAAGLDPAVMFKVHDTICRQVSNRGVEIREFAGRFDLVVFVSDPKSSNGKQLFEICRNSNRLSYFVTGPDDLKSEWFTSVERVGICGATSTPQWVMEAVRERIKEMS